MIGIFDSGIGGLSVFKEIRKLLPDEKYVYYSDNAHCPYGEKSKEYIINRSRWITDFLLSKGADIIVVACNTATAFSIATLRQEYPSVRFIGMEPAIKPAAKMTGTGTIGVLATAGTFQTDKYKDNRGRWSENVSIKEMVGKGFVELVEKGELDSEEAEQTISRSIKPLLDSGADTIVLGCTHYPFLSETIRKVASRLYPDREIKLIDPAPAVAKHLVEVMKEEKLLNDSGSTYSIQLFASGDMTGLEAAYKRIDTDSK